MKGFIAAVLCILNHMTIGSTFETVAVGNQHIHDSSSTVTSVGTEQVSHEATDSTMLGHAQRFLHTDSVVSVGTEIGASGVLEATLVGSHLNASDGANQCVLIGTNLHAKRARQVIVGSYAAMSDADFVVGAGSAELPMNVLEVFANGTIWHNGAAAESTASLRSDIALAQDESRLQREAVAVLNSTVMTLMSELESLKANLTAQQCMYSCATVRNEYQQQCCGNAIHTTNMYL